MYRYDWWTQDDERVDIPEGRNVAVYDVNSTRTANCCHCGLEIDQDSSHPSEQYHTRFGMPMRVCMGCLMDEIEHRNEAWAERHGW